MQHGLSEELYSRVSEYGAVDEFTDREKLAIEYAERFILDHRQIGSDFIDRMRAVYSDQEIVELAGLVAFCLGVGRVYRVLEIANECAIVH